MRKETELLFWSGLSSFLVGVTLTMAILLANIQRDLHKTERAWILTMIMYAAAKDPGMTPADGKAIEQAMTGASHKLVQAPDGNVYFRLYRETKDSPWSFVSVVPTPK